VKIVGTVIAIWLLLLVFGWQVLAITGSAAGGESVQGGLLPVALITLLGVAGGLLVAWLVFPARRDSPPAQPVRPPSGADISTILEGHFVVALEQAPVGIVMIDAEGRYLWVNREFCGMLGYEADDLHGRNFREFTHPDDLANDEKALDEALSGRPAATPTRKRYLHKDGSIVWVNRNSIFVAGGEEHGDCVLAMMENITERKTAEEALGESRLCLKDAQRIARLAYWSWDIASGRVTRGAEAIEMLGCGDSGIEPTVEALYRYIHPDDADDVRAWLEAARSGERDHSGHDYRIIRDDGSLRHVHGEARVERHPDGTVGRIWGIALDVTGRMTTEEKLRQRESQLRNAQRLTHIGDWEWDIENQRVFRSDEIYRIFGRNRDEMAETVEAFRECIHPDDRAAHLEWSSKAGTESGRDYSGDYRIVRPDGEIRHVHAEGKVERNDSGKAVRVWGTIQDITERQAVEDALRASEASLKAAQHLAHVGSWEWNVRDDILTLSDEFHRICGRDPQNPIDSTDLYLSFIHPDDQDFVHETAESIARLETRGFSINYRICRRDGTVRHVHDEATSLFDENGAKIGATGIVQDITERVLAEEKLRQAQKMEVVGRLTGGVAHDFNNLLSIVTGNLELVRDAFDDGNKTGQNNKTGYNEKTRGYLDAASRAAWRGADLVQRLLSFSRRQILQPETIRVDDLIAQTTVTITQQLGDSITVRNEATPGLWPTRVDRNQLENCLIDLARNARDAMPEGGTLTFSCRNDTLDAPREDLEIEPGDYVVIAVSDTGIGIDETQRHLIFEPFFTTRDVGAGSGLGLSMVHGFVKQSGGGITFDSTPGEGTTCSLYLPRSTEGPTA